MASVYTVGQVNGFIKRMFDDDIMLRNISIQGEVSNYKPHSSGHIYFTLKDTIGAISCVMFASHAAGLTGPVRNGDKVIARGSVSVYERDGKYQLYVKSMMVDGVGLLYQQYEQLKRKLEQNGMFDPMNKKSIPPFVRKVGIVTAATGAVIRDIVNVAGRRNPYVQLILYPAKVQGQGAAQTIVRGIETLDRMDTDVIIVGRGGGSIEDLWAFNEESVAEAIFYAGTPVISAVGHETDYTIADFVSDLRAPTPSAAAELAVFDYGQACLRIAGLRDRFSRHMGQRVSTARQRVAGYTKQMSYVSPWNQLTKKRQYAMELEEKLSRIMQQKVTDRRQRLSLYAERMKGASPLNALSRGYAYVTNQEGQAVLSVGQAKVGDELRLHLTDGELTAAVRGTKTVNPRGANENKKN